MEEALTVDDDLDLGENEQKIDELIGNLEIKVENEKNPQMKVSKQK